jgi:GntR family transcriptional regulator
MTIGNRHDDRSGGKPAQGQDVVPIEFRLDPGSGVPTYLQLVRQVEHALRLGRLEIGDKLPTVKATVESLAINPNTVLKAYRELEVRGLAAGRPGQGTFVAGTLGQVAAGELAALRTTLLDWLASAEAAGLDHDAIVALFTSAAADFRGRRGTEGVA